MISACENKPSRNTNNLSFDTPKKTTNDDLSRYNIEPNATYEEITKKMEAAKLIDPNNAEIYILLGNVYSGKKEYLKAIENYKKLIEIKSEYVAGYNSLGTSYMDVNNGKLAAYYLEEGLTKCKGHNQKFDCVDLIQNIATTYLFYDVTDNVKENMLKVISYSTEGLELTDEKNDMIMYTRFKYLIGEAYLKLSGKQNLQKAIMSFREVTKYKESPWYDISHKKLNYINGSGYGE